MGLGSSNYDELIPHNHEIFTGAGHQMGSGDTGGMGGTTGLGASMPPINAGTYDPSTNIGGNNPYQPKGQMELAKPVIAGGRMVPQQGPRGAGRDEFSEPIGPEIHGTANSFASPRDAAYANKYQEVKGPQDAAHAKASADLSEYASKHQKLQTPSGGR